jgi:hypothetical protein
MCCFTFWGKKNKTIKHNVNHDELSNFFRSLLY